MSKKRRNWVLILFGVAVLLVFVGIGAIVTISAWVQQNLEVQDTTAGDAQTQFDAVRQQFGSRAPLLELRDGTPVYADPAHSSPAEASTELQTLYVLAWDPQNERLAKFTLPFWLLRLKSTPIQLSSYASSLDDNRVRLRVEDIERYGAGIILDTTTSTGERVLLWAR